MLFPYKLLVLSERGCGKGKPKKQQTNQQPINQQGLKARTGYKFQLTHTSVICPQGSHFALLSLDLCGFLICQMRMNWNHVHRSPCTARPREVSIPSSFPRPSLCQTQVTELITRGGWLYGVSRCVLLCCAVVSGSLRPRGLWPARLLCLWIFQARILGWVAISSSQRSSQPRD